MIDNKNIKRNIQDILPKEYNILINNEEDDIIIYLSLKDILIIKLSILKDSPNNMWIEELYVENNFRNKGFAKNIMMLIPSIANIFKCNFLSLFVKKDTWINKWYNNLGYMNYTICDSDKTYIKCIKII